MFAKESEKNTGLMDKIIALCKRRGFVFPGSEIYGGLANSWDYGPMGVELKNNIKNLWWDYFVKKRDDMVGIDAALIMNPKVWEASGHLKNFSDPLVECKKCHARLREDQLPSDKKCSNCGAKDNYTPAKQFNLMMKTFLGPAEEAANTVYFRPETAQAMFVDFKNVMDSVRPKLPFGMAQIGKAFRNEITPGNFIFRTREFEQMEIEYFIPAPKSEDEWNKKFEYWLGEMREWLAMIGVRNYMPVEISDADRAFYSKRTIDIEFKYPFGQKELYGLAYRTDYDLKSHFKESPPYKDPETNEAYYPHVIEPSFGVDRSVLAVLCDAYTEEEGRVVLKLKPNIAPFKAAVFPLLRNKPELVALAREIYSDLKKDINVLWDDRGNIGKRYYAQDEIGTPYCITVDFDTLEGADKFVTVRDRDTMKQERVKISELKDWLKAKLSS